MATALLQATKTRTGRIPDGDAGTKAMLESMQRNVKRDYLKPVVRLTAVELVRFLPPRADTEHAQAIRDWMRDRVKFLRDPAGAELNHSPEWMIKAIQRHGIVNVDCDDAAVLSAALGKAIGLRARFIAAAFRSKAAGFSHVWAELSSPLRPVWIEQDVTRAAQGIAIANVTRRMEMEV